MSKELILLMDAPPIGSDRDGGTTDDPQDSVLEKWAGCSEEHRRGRFGVRQCILTSGHGTVTVTGSNPLSQTIIKLHRIYETTIFNTVS